MIVKISKGEKGVADYLKTGKKRDSKLTRDEKDSICVNYHCVYRSTLLFWLLVLW